MEKHKVVVHISGGVADTAFVQGDIEVVILDFDNFRDGNAPIDDMGSDNKGHVCPECKREGSEFEWNAATLLTYGDDIVPIQTAGKEDVYVCAFCFKENSYDTFV
jgi:hypothetical protein